LSRKKAMNSIPLKPMTNKEQKVVQSDVTVLLAIRRPGCGACRGHGR